MALDRSGTTQDARRDEASDRQATIGLVFLLLVAVGLLCAIWIARVQFVRAYALYDVELAGQVQGLSKGGAVFLNGVRTGEVIDLALDPSDPSKVVARIRVSADTPVRQDSAAALEWLGVSGSRFIQLSGGSLSKPLLSQVASAHDIPVIHSAAAAFDSKNPEGKSAAAQALEALDLLNRRLSDENLAVIGGALANARTIAGTWRGDAKNLATLDSQLLKTSQITQKLAESAQSAKSELDGDLHRKLERLADGSAEARASIRSARSQIRQVQATTGAGLQTLPAITSQIEQVQGMVERAGEVIGRFDSQDPHPLGPPASQELKLAP